jgi:hypothetical protein
MFSCSSLPKGCSHLRAAAFAIRTRNVEWWPNRKGSAVTSGVPTRCAGPRRSTGLDRHIDVRTRSRPRWPDPEGHLLRPLSRWCTRVLRRRGRGRDPRSLVSAPGAGLVQHHRQSAVPSDERQPRFPDRAPPVPRHAEQPLCRGRAPRASPVCEAENPVQWGLVQPAARDDDADDLPPRAPGASRAAAACPPEMRDRAPTDEASEATLTIDDLAAESRVPSRTIRFYQSRGALIAGSYDHEQRGAAAQPDPACAGRAGRKRHLPRRHRHLRCRRPGPVLTVELP